ncbi:hypothetical protein PFISCL1PPCAC_18612, partial [Pristionchus fissidentatus]
SRIIDRNNLHFSIQLENIAALGEPALLDRYLERVVLVECTNEMLDKAAEYAMPTCMIDSITKRKQTISNLLPVRPNLHFVFLEGEMIVSLFNDVRPQFTSQLVFLVQQHGLRFFFTDEMTHDPVFNVLHAPMIAVFRDLRLNESERQSLLFHSKCVCLYWRHTHDWLFFSESVEDCCALGVVVSGKELVMNAT